MLNRIPRACCGQQFEGNVCSGAGATLALGFVNGSAPGVEIYGSQDPAV